MINHFVLLNPMTLRSRLGTVLLATLLAAVVAIPGAAPAQTKAADVLDAVVGLKADIRADARTARTLGRVRVGSGVVIDSQGLVLTVGYLIMEAETVTLLRPNGVEVPATVVAYDWETGFGLVRAARPLKVKPIALGSAAKLKTSSRALIATYTGPVKVQGVHVVSRREFSGYWEYVLDNAIFTAPIHMGFGGAALIGPDGKLVGIGALAVANAGDPDTRSPGNMFIPIDALKPALAELLLDGYQKKTDKPWLGVFTRVISGRLYIIRVAAGGPAAKANVQRGDRVVSVNGIAVTGQANFYRKVWAAGKPGTTVHLQVVRGPETLDIPVRSGSRYTWLRLK